MKNQIVAVQINGKNHCEIKVPTGASDEAHAEIAARDEKVHEGIDGKYVKRYVIVPGRIVNVVTN